MMSSLEIQFKQIQANVYLKRMVIQEVTFNMNKIWKSIQRFFRDTSRIMINFKISIMSLIKRGRELKLRTIHLREESMFQEVRDLRRNMILMRRDLLVHLLNDVKI